ncbi:hypothetical protein CQY20_09200 [Mycolicibacterium agri]|uniref:Uncharacterized protein n=1 Tax=Mycolicibacterium agri TaxID=36811 RepID=A0A2A7N7A8_MYCAG|nr:hypothetical protein [Mycolicibacterium agri]PEG39719.1 hypothetical protein CQY20_09200 [Mycolicibacterium agri]GFG52574.1 hypothetical protein MAGR_40150 [Mycolicibacterium agri]
MTTHAEAMVERLPTLYSDGDLVRGLAAVFGLQLEILDEEARIVQRAHWFDTTVELVEAAALGALLDIAPETWQELDEYRAWFHALRTARLRYGAVCTEALTVFTQSYADEFQKTNNIRALADFDTWSTQLTEAGHALVENPPQHATLRLGGPDGIEPLHRQVCNQGLDTALLSVLFTGGGHSEYVPVLVNRTTGAALAYLDELRPGDRLWLQAAADGSITAQLNRADATERLRGIEQVTPGTPWRQADVSSPPRALSLLPGANDLWFVPVAHFDAPGLDRALLALAGLDMTEGRWDETFFDHALFYADPAAYLDLSWRETPPATVLVDLDASALTNSSGRRDDAMQAREQFAGSVQDGIRRLTAAGVRAEVRMRPLHDSQRQLDHLTFMSGMAHREVGSVGIDQLTNSGGRFGVTAYDDSTYQ